ncbi:hypothetical protein FSP39_013001 [Pinctada imbricata]|uniref:PH domain-containing protein n=1 Tax=Pinctada imbricata TaxID=66713 RepID=A0AA89BUL5_PINIB|nr:hypothetical protein FSP39_013001 [Pinctada imbricata]
MKKVYFYWTKCPDYLYKLSGNKGKSLWNKNNPWKQRYFVLKRVGNKPVLEYHNKKPKNKNAVPKDLVTLWPSYRLEKVTNTRHRAYVFELTTPEKYLCLSADEQRHMDMFVFVIQAQTQLKEQIKDDMIMVQPENSEAQRRIGAKGANCILHASPWGVTLALQSSRSILAQWPMKSVRYFEASGKGQFMLEAGRVAPMGDGMYVFHTQKGKDNSIYDIMDQNIVNALGKTQPNRRGTTEEVEDYVIEADKLSALTTVCPCTMSQPELPTILQDNWNFTSPHVPATTRPRPIVHTRQSNDNTQLLTNNPTSPPPLPDRRPSDTQGSITPSSSKKNLLHTVSSSSLGSSQCKNLADRPPLPPPTGAHSSPKPQTRQRPVQSKPLSIPKSPSASDARVSQAYLRMDSNSSLKMASSLTPFSPTTADMTPPPTYPEATAYSPMEKVAPNRDGYLEPRNSAEIAAELNARESQNGFPEQYILPTSEQHDPYDLQRGHHHGNNRQSDELQVSSNFRLNRLRSASCEEINNTYMGGRVLRERKGSQDYNANEKAYDLAKPQAPFENLQNFRGSLELLCDNKRTSGDYYNINGLKGTVDTSPAPTVKETRKRFNEGFRSDTMQRSISNPNFFNIHKKEKINDARSGQTKSANLESQPLNPKRKSKSLINLFKKSSRDKSAGKTSDRSSVGSSTPSSPTGTLTRETSVPMITIGGSQVFITERTRSFRRPKSRPDQQDSDSGSQSNRSSRSSSISKSPNGSHSSTRYSNYHQHLPSTSPRTQKKDLAKRQDSSTSLPLNIGNSTANVKVHDGTPYSDGQRQYNTYSLDRSAGRTTRYVAQNATSPRLPQRSGATSPSYVNVVHGRSSSDSLSTANSMQRNSSSSSCGKPETVC